MGAEFDLVAPPWVGTDLFFVPAAHFDVEGGLDLVAKILLFRIA
jgi:hypothetical protein